MVIEWIVGWDGMYAIDRAASLTVNCSTEDDYLANIATFSINELLADIDGCVGEVSSKVSEATLEDLQGLREEFLDFKQSIKDASIE